MYLEFFCPRAGQGFRPSAAHVNYPTPFPRAFTALFNFDFFKIVRYLFINI